MDLPSHLLLYRMYCYIIQTNTIIERNSQTYAYKIYLQNGSVTEKTRAEMYYLV